MNLEQRVTFQSGDWLYIKECIEKAIAHQRSQLENPTTTYRETILARGRIVALKQILNLPQTASTAA